MRPLLARLQGFTACAQPLEVSAWLQHVLQGSVRSMQFSSSSSSVQSSKQQQKRSKGTAPGQQQQQDSERALLEAQQEWNVQKEVQFSVRPSVLSPLHAYHKEVLAGIDRLKLLDTTMRAHFKLAEELSPDELEEQALSPDPVAAALAARRQKLQEVYDNYEKLLHNQIAIPPAEPEHMGGYFALLDTALRARDPAAKELQKVIDGKRDVWNYWFEDFAPDYAGLPGLGSLESIYNQQDAEVAKQQLSQLQAAEEKPPPQPQLDRLGRATATGGRKTSVAQVFLWRGQGRILVNRKLLDAYFSDLLMRSHVLKPLMTTGLVGQLDVLVHVKGGGVSGQAQAAAHGIARALVRLDPSLKQQLKSAKLLRRDPRSVERKKFGRAKARKAFAWVKR